MNPDGRLVWNHGEETSIKVCVCVSYVDGWIGRSSVRWIVSWMGG